MTTVSIMNGICAEMPFFLMLFAFLLRPIHRFQKMELIIKE